MHTKNIHSGITELLKMFNAPIFSGIRTKWKCSVTLMKLDHKISRVQKKNIELRLQNENVLGIGKKQSNVFVNCMGLNIV